MQDLGDYEVRLLPDSNRKKSVVWSHFGHLLRNSVVIDETNLYCNLCVANGKLHPK